jgi:hypothetical protein
MFHGTFLALVFDCARLCWVTNTLVRGMPRRITLTELTGLQPKEANFVIEYAKDFDARRAAEASGYSADYGYTLRDQANIQESIQRILATRLETSHIDAEWALMEAVDNHLIARQKGNITASNTALGLVFKHTYVDAMAAEKVEVHNDKEVMERLQRGRKRLQQLEDDEISFM